MLVASLLTLGSPDQMTGGHLYHCRVSELAPAHGAHLDLVSLPALPFPRPMAFGRRLLRRVRGGDIVVVDCIAAAYLAPWHPAPTLVAMLHQPPGHIDHGPVRRPVHAWLDGPRLGGVQAPAGPHRGGAAGAGRRPALGPPGARPAPRTPRRAAERRQLGACP
jgi:hypothetical protein